MAWFLCQIVWQIADPAYGKLLDGVRLGFLMSQDTVYPKKYAHGFVVLCFVVVMQSFIMNSHEVFIHIHQGCFAGTGAIIRLPQCQRSKPDGYGKISQCITTTKHSKAKTVCTFLGIYCIETLKSRLIDIDIDDKPRVLHVYPTRNLVQEYNHIRQIQWGTEAVEILAEHYLIVQKIYLQVVK